MSDVETVPTECITCGRAFTPEDYYEFRQKRHEALRNGTDCAEYIREKYGKKYCCPTTLMCPPIKQREVSMSAIPKSVLSFRSDTALESTEAPSGSRITIYVQDRARGVTSRSAPIRKLVK